MSLVKKLADQTAIYGLSSIVGRFLNYLLVPLYTNIFTRAEYGVTSWFYAIVPFIAVFFTYGMETAFFRFAQKSEDKERVFATTMISMTVSSVILSLLIILFATPIADFTKNSGRESFFVYFSIILAADTITTIPFAWLRLQNEAMRFAMLRLLGIGVNIGLNLIVYLLIPFLVHHGLFAPLESVTQNSAPSDSANIKWMIMINMVSSLVVLPFFAKEFKMMRLGFDALLWKEMFHYAYPVILMGLAGMINETLDRVLLKELIPNQTFAEEQIGIYSANYKLSILITLFIQAFRFAAEPFFFARAKEGDAKQTYATVMQYFTIVCTTIFLVVMLYIDIFKYFIGEKFREGLAVVPILLIANIFLGMYYNLSIWYKLTDKTRLGALVSFGGAIITLILNWLWIPTYSYMGSAWATLICYFSMAIMSYWLGQKYYPVAYPLRRITSYLALSLTVFMVSEMLKDAFLTTPSPKESSWTVYTTLLINTILFGTYLFVVYKMEENAIKKWLPARFFDKN